MAPPFLSMADAAARPRHNRTYGNIIMVLTFELYRGEDGDVHAEAQGLPITASGSDLGGLLAKIQEHVDKYYTEEAEAPWPERIYVVWREGEEGPTN